MFFTTLLKRILIAIPTLIALTMILFFMVKQIPGDPAQLLLGDKANKESLESLRKEMGLDKPLAQQYFIYVKNLVVNQDMGRSITTSEPNIDIVKNKFPATFELASLAILFAVLIGLPAGLIASAKSGSLFDLGFMSMGVFGVSMPVFWLGLILMWTFGLTLEWLPISGRLSIDYYYEPTTGFLLYDSLFVEKDFNMFIDAFKHLILPAITLGTIPMAFIARMTRSSMLEASKADYIRTAKAKGLSRFKIYIIHTLKNAIIPVITVMGLQFGTLLGGAMITETIFSWPGMGTWILNSVNARDLPAIQSGVMVIAISFILINLIVDLLYRLFDPRIRVG